ncbi:MAG: DNA polymerase I [Clostridia bacterium]|nr:DNA polymerase I [Clostridia bacterium]
MVRLFKEEGDLLALSLGLDKAYYVEKSSMLNEVENIYEDDMLNLLYDVYENENLMKIGYDLKSDFRFLVSKKEGFRPANYYDLMIAYYSWTTSNGPFGLRDFATNYLGCDICNEDETFIPTGKAKDRILVIDLGEEKRSKLLVEFFNAVSNGKDNMDAEFKQDADKGKLFTDIENPLVYVLAKIEATGITVDTEELRNYSKDINDKLKVVTEKIYELAGEEFNISSPKQLGEILFTKLGIESKKKTKTGMSTSAETLEKLVDVHPIIPEILSYRQLEKLRSTYADGLFEYIKSDNKIHTTFTQVVTSTGRLSSTDPNLQNIPIRMELGRQVRKAFVPKSEDYVFVDADYSQVELRIMAHMSGDQKLIEGYKSKEDIHKLTASEVFGVPLDEVTKEQRSAAKAVNFGIIYGISSFGLSEDIHVTKKEAQSYIEKYFEKYSRVKEYLDELVSSAEKTGCSKTLFGRMRKIDEIHSTNFMRKEFGKRAAMNSPIQGTAADIMKLAMVKFNDRIEKEKLDAKILVQVHDELLVECHKDIKEKVGAILEEEMEKACELLVPLVAEVSYGSTWYETK